MLILMGSGAQTAAQTVGALNARGERVEVIQLRMYRPFPPRHFWPRRPRQSARSA